jgi:hypothetical protein
MAAHACCDCDRDNGCKTGQCRAVAGRCRALDADGRARGSFGRAGRDDDGRPFLTVARFVFESARPSSSASEQARPLSVTIRILASSIWSAGGRTHHAGAAALESAVRACARPNEIEEHRAFWPRATRCPVRLWRIFAELQPSDPLTKAGHDAATALPGSSTVSQAGHQKALRHPAHDPPRHQAAVPMDRKASP